MKPAYEILLPDQNGNGLLQVTLIRNCHFVCKFCVLLSVMLTVSIISIAQSIYPSTINSTGRFGTMPGFQFEISIAEATSIVTLSNSLMSVTSGVLQTSVVYQPPASPSAPLSDEIKLYPNPARSFVDLNFFGKMMGLFQYELFDLTGNKITTARFFYFGVPVTQRIDINRLWTGTYILSVRRYNYITNKLEKEASFKIIKVN